MPELIGPTQAGVRGSNAKSRSIVPMLAWMRPDSTAADLLSGHIAVSWRRLKRHHAAVMAAQVIVVVLFLLIWEVAAGEPARGAVLDQVFVGKPSLIGQQTLIWLADGTLSVNAWQTIQEAVLGFVCGSLCGIAAGLVFGATKVGRSVLGPLVYLAYSVPRLALAPLFILWFGIGTESKVALVTLIVFFYVFFNAYEGARQVDDDLTAVCRMMRASRLQILAKVTLPSALMWVAVGLKVSLPHAFGGAIVGEIIAGRTGLGVLMSRSSHALDANGLFSAAVASAVLTIALSTLVGLGMGLGLRWRQAGGGGGTELL